MLEDELFGRYELTAQQYNLLRLLRGVFPSGLPTLDLASRLISRAPDITRMIDKLEDRGLVNRERPPDNRRVVLVALTDVGRELLSTLDQPVRDCHVRQLGHMEPDQMRQLIELLQESRRPHESAGSPWE